MSKKLIAINIAAYFTFILLTLALAVNAGNIQNLNIVESYNIQLFHVYYVDVFLSYLTFLMSGEVCVFFSVIFSIYCYIYHRPIYLVMWLFMAGVAVELIIKHYLFMPKIDLDHRDIFHLGLSIETNYSYPSGHALRSTFFGVLLAYFAIRYLKWSKGITITIAAITTILLLYSRSYLGVHWFVDVIGGGLLGLGLGFTGILICEGIAGDTKKNQTNPK